MVGFCHCIPSFSPLSPCLQPHKKQSFPCKCWVIEMYLLQALPFLGEANLLALDTQRENIYLILMVPASFPCPWLASCAHFILEEQEPPDFQYSQE